MNDYQRRQRELRRLMAGFGQMPSLPGSADTADEIIAAMKSGELPNIPGSPYSTTEIIAALKDPGSAATGKKVCQVAASVGAGAVGIPLPPVVSDLLCSPVGELWSGLTGEKQEARRKAKRANRRGLAYYIFIQMLNTPNLARLYVADSKTFFQKLERKIADPKTYSPPLKFLTYKGNQWDSPPDDGEVSSKISHWHWPGAEPDTGQWRRSLERMLLATPEGKKWFNDTIAAAKAQPQPSPQEVKAVADREALLQLDAQLKERKRNEELIKLHGQMVKKGIIKEEQKKQSQDQAASAARRGDKKAADAVGGKAKDLKRVAEKRAGSAIKKRSEVKDLKNQVANLKKKLLEQSANPIASKRLKKEIEATSSKISQASEVGLLTTALMQNAAAQSAIAQKVSEAIASGNSTAASTLTGMYNRLTETAGRLKALLSPMMKS